VEGHFKFVDIENLMHLKLHHFSPLGRSLASVLCDGGFDVGNDGNSIIANRQWAKLFFIKLTYMSALYAYGFNRVREKERDRMA
jgi:hypothetical protein